MRAQVRCFQVAVPARGYNANGAKQVGEIAMNGPILDTCWKDVRRAVQWASLGTSLAACLTLQWCDFAAGHERVRRWL